MSARVAKNPAAAVHVDDDREHAGGSPRFDEANAYLACRGWHRDPLLVDRRFLDRPGLCVVQDPAGGGWFHLVYEWRFREGFGEIPRGGFQDDRAHESSPCRWLKRLRSGQRASARDFLRNTPQTTEPTDRLTHFSYRLDRKQRSV